MLALLASTNGCAAADLIVGKRPASHLLQHSQGFLPLLALLASTNGCSVADLIGGKRPGSHLLQQSQGFLPLLAHFSKGGQAVEGSPEIAAADDLQGTCSGG